MLPLSQLVGATRKRSGSPLTGYARAGATARVAAGLALVAGATALLVATGTSLATAESVLLLMVVGASVLSYVAGLAAAVAAFAALNYYFTEPLHSFRIAHTENLVALVVFVAIAAIVGAGVARLYELRARSERGEREAMLRLTFISQLATGTDPAIVFDDAAGELVTLFDLAWCEITTGNRTFRAQSPRTETDSIPFTPHRGFQLEIGIAHPMPPGDLHAIEALGASLATTLDRIRLDEEARAAHARGELARSRAGFLTAITHDLRTPLSTIKAGTGALLAADRNLSDEERRRVLEVAHDEAARLERLVTNVLELTRIRGFSLRPEPVAVSADDLVRAAVKRLQRQTEHRTITMDIGDDLPALLVDAGMLEHVVVNLLENALRYSPGGRAIEITAIQGADTQQLRVVDHGPGVAPADRERMYDEFVRLGAAAGSSGTGLGLAIVRGFVEANQGHVWYEETDGGGSTFVVELPAASGEDEE